MKLKPTGFSTLPKVERVGWGGHLASELGSEHVVLLPLAFPFDSAVPPSTHNMQAENEAQPPPLRYLHPYLMVQATETTESTSRHTVVS